MTHVWRLFFMQKKKRFDRAAYELLCFLVYTESARDEDKTQTQSKTEKTKKM